jgi:hypothetical protein
MRKKNLFDWFEVGVFVYTLEPHKRIRQGYAFCGFEQSASTRQLQDPQTKALPSLCYNYNGSRPQPWCCGVVVYARLLRA